MDDYADNKLRELNKWKERYELALLVSNDGLWDWYLQTNTVYLSPSFKDMLGYSDHEMENSLASFEDNLHPDDSEHTHNAMNDYISGITEKYVVEFRMQHKDRHYVHILSKGVVHRDNQGEPLRFIGIHIDVSASRQTEQRLIDKNFALEDANAQLKEAQKMLLQQEKMASIGQLAAGVAHEINNPIGFIQSNVKSLKKYVVEIFSLLKAYEKAESEIQNKIVLEKIHQKKDESDIDYVKEDINALIEETQDGLTRIIKIVHDLKDFSYMGEDEWETVEITKGIDSTLNIVHNELKYKADIIKEYQAIPEIECIPSQLNQVFMNLLVNAAHAIDEKGKVIIRTGMADEKHIFIEIIDSGHGIPKDNIDKIFDPFFTTKEIGKGTGLGLSLTYGIIEKHQGKISVQSEVNQGSTFRIKLPITTPYLDKL
jgi:two-component system NtrC family sensor kinase